MNKKFAEIKRHYDDFHRFLLKRGVLPVRDTGVGYWGVSPLDDIYHLFCSIRLENYKRFIDLGSGDGRVVLVASLFTNAEGVEADAWLHSVSTHMKQRLSHIPETRKAVFHQKDFFQHDISAYDAVFHHPDKPMYRGVESKLLKELNGTLILYGHHFHPSSLKKEESIQVGDAVATLYKRPPNARIQDKESLGRLF